METVIPLDQIFILLTLCWIQLHHNSIKVTQVFVYAATSVGKVARVYS